MELCDRLLAYDWRVHRFSHRYYIIGNGPCSQYSVDNRVHHSGDKKYLSLRLFFPESGGNHWMSGQKNEDN